MWRRRGEGRGTQGRVCLASDSQALGTAQSAESEINNCNSPPGARPNSPRLSLRTPLSLGTCKKKGGVLRMHSQGTLRDRGLRHGGWETAGNLGYTSSPQIQSPEGRTRAWREKTEVNGSEGKGLNTVDKSIFFS